MSLDAKRAWDDNPILTTVSTTALPIHELEYPAITICGQGMASETLDKVKKTSENLQITTVSTVPQVLKQRFDSWMAERGLDPRTASSEEVSRWKRDYEQESFPGLSVPMDEVSVTQIQSLSLACLKPATYRHARLCCAGYGDDDGAGPGRGGGRQGDQRGGGRVAVAAARRLPHWLGQLYQGRSHINHARLGCEY